MDLDNDGISNVAEQSIYGTNANRADSDEDGANDGLEIAIGSNPLKSDMLFIAQFMKIFPTLVIFFAILMVFFSIYCVRSLKEVS